MMKERRRNWSCQVQQLTWASALRNQSPVVGLGAAHLGTLSGGAS